MRKLIIVGLGIAILGGAFLLSKYFKDNKKVSKQRVDKIEKTVFVENVINSTIPIVITANGNLKAKNKVELYSEVQGVLIPTGKDFKAGVIYKKGQSLLNINSNEHYASLQSQRSSLQNLVASIMPDLRLDYPDSFEKWNTYLKNFNINKSVSKLPKATSDKEKYFITGKNIYTTYYNIKNLEARLAKYNLRAPFDGVLTETLVTNGTLVRSGQKMGEFIDTSIFELQVSVNASYANILNVGKEVSLQNLEKTSLWAGKVSRINGRIDQSTQTVQVFIEVKGKDLREGMYLEANVPAKEEVNAIEIPRKLLIENKSVYIVKGNVLELVEITPIYFNEKTVVVKGLVNGTQMVSKPIAGGYSGMLIKVFTETNTTKSE